MKYTEDQMDEIRAAVEVAKKKAKARCPGPDLGALTADVIAALTARKLRDDLPMICNTSTESDLLITCFDLPDDASDIRALVTTDEVLEWARRQFSADIIDHRNCNESEAAWKATIDAYQYGRE